MPGVEEMRLLSKVLKAGQLNIRSPLTVKPRVEIEIDSDVPQGEQGEIAGEAAAILRETEERVRQLMEQARREGEKIINNAREEAARILAEAQGKREEILAESRRRGYEEGFRAGREEGLATWQERLAEIEKSAVKALEEKEKILRAAEAEIVQLAVAVAGRIIRREVTLDSTIVLRIVREALNRVTDREEVVIKVNPEDLDLVLAAQEEIRGGVAGIGKLKIVADAGVSRGGCVIENAGGTVDARLERQLEEIEAALLEKLGTETER